MNINYIKPPQRNVNKIDGLTKIEALDLYERLHLIRTTQLKIAEEYHYDEIKTPVHLCVGEEAIAVGICSALRKDDFIQSNHRSHGHYLAKGGNLESLIAELYGKETGCSKGRGGSMHVIDTSVGHYGSSSIVAGGVPIAVGMALASSLQNDDKVAVTFFGDAAAEEGVVYESLQFAVLKRLPVLFICENNFYAVCSPIANRQSTDNLYQRFEGLAIPSYRCDGIDVVEIYLMAKEIIKKIREGSGPVFLELKAYRWFGHAGDKEDFSLGYRTEEELRAWQSVCPLAVYRERLLLSDLANEDVLDEIEKNNTEKIKDAFVFAQNSAYPKPEEVEEYLFAD